MIAACSFSRNKSLFGSHGESLVMTSHLQVSFSWMLGVLVSIIEKQFSLNGIDILSSGNMTE
jgi:hypothetical protein